MNSLRFRSGTLARSLAAVSSGRTMVVRTLVIYIRPIRMMYEVGLCDLLYA